MIRLLLIIVAMGILCRTSCGEQTIARYRFDSLAGSAFWYFSDGLDVSADISGTITIVKDNTKGDAYLDFGNVSLSSAMIERGDPDHKDYFEGATLASIAWSLETPIPAERITAASIQFGPSTSTQPGFPGHTFVRTFTLTDNAGSLRLIGSSEFFGYDGPTYYFNGPLSQVPEPSTATLSSVFGAALLCWLSAKRAAKREA
jgi:hypothetical protein